MLKKNELRTLSGHIWGGLNFLLHLDIFFLAFPHFLQLAQVSFIITEIKYSVLCFPFFGKMSRQVDQGSENFHEVFPKTSPVTLRSR